MTAIGLSLQSSLSNFASGVLMLIFKPIRIGDFIEAGGTMGAVKEVGIFNTILTTPDNKKVIVPNAKATGDNIVNWTVKGSRRVDMVMGIGYDTVELALLGEASLGRVVTAIRVGDGQAQDTTAAHVGERSLVLDSQVNVAALETKMRVTGERAW